MQLVCVDVSARQRRRVGWGGGVSRGITGNGKVEIRNVLGVIVSYWRRRLVCVLAPLSRPSWRSPGDAFKGPCWQQNGLNGGLLTEYISNLRACNCGAAAFARLMPRLRIHHALRSSLCYSGSCRKERRRETERQRVVVVVGRQRKKGALDHLLLCEVSHLANIWIANAGKVIWCRTGTPSYLHTCQPL